jgi:hypothetical protein
LIARTHVNLVDLVDAGATGKPVRVFATEEELAGYTLRAQKVFPRESAKAGGLLKKLLRKIVSVDLYASTRSD